MPNNTSATQHPRKKVSFSSDTSEPSTRTLSRTNNQRRSAAPAASTGANSAANDDDEIRTSLPMNSAFFRPAVSSTAQTPEIRRPLWAIRKAIKLKIERLSLAEKISRLPDDQMKLSNIAMAVMRQLVEMVHHIEVVRGVSDLNINPSTVLFEVVSDGKRDADNSSHSPLQYTDCIKLAEYNYLNKKIIEDTRNKQFFFESPFVAPELRNSLDERMKADGKADVWAIGAVILAILLKRTFQPSWNQVDPYAEAFFEKRFRNEQASQNIDPAIMKMYLEYKETTIPPTEQQQTSYEHDMAYFENLVRNGTNEQWQRVIPNNELRYAVRRCLVIDVTLRATLAELQALIYLIGGVEEKPEPSINSKSHPWSTPMSALQPVEGIDDTFHHILLKNLEQTEVSTTRYLNNDEIILTSAGSETLRDLAIMSHYELVKHKDRIKNCGDNQSTGPSQRSNYLETQQHMIVVKRQKFALQYLKDLPAPKAADDAAGHEESLEAACPALNV